jgi:hypothetical protein
MVYQMVNKHIAGTPCPHARIVNKNIAGIACLQGSRR